MNHIHKLFELGHVNHSLKIAHDVAMLGSCPRLTDVWNPAMYPFTSNSSMADGSLFNVYRLPRKYELLSSPKIWNEKNSY